MQKPTFRMLESFRLDVISYRGKRCYDSYDDRVSPVVNGWSSKGSLRDYLGLRGVVIFTTNIRFRLELLLLWSSAGRGRHL
jgi:hypothetical protein